MTPLPMFGLALLLAFAADARRPHGRLVYAAVTALLLSAAGDWTGNFVIKMGLFALAHVAYIVAFWKPESLLEDRSTTYLWVGTVVAIAGAGVVSYEQPQLLIGGMLLYGFLLALVASLALCLSRLAGIGAVIFMASDLLVGWSAFHQHPAALDVIAVGLYIIAQSLIAAAVIRISQEKK